MTGERVAVLDASSTLFGGGSTSSSSLPSSSSPALPILLPIPDFKTLVVDAIKSVHMKDEHARVACIDIGVICDSPVVNVMARALHERVLKKLSEVTR